MKTRKIQNNESAHILDLIDYNYYINNVLKEEDLKNKVTYIKKMESNVNYLYIIIKEEYMQNKINDSSGNKIIKYKKNKYDIINIDYTCNNINNL